MSDVLLISVALCTLATLGFAITSLYDIIKGAWFVSKGKEYKWQAFSAFTENKDWKSIIILGVVMCIGVWGAFRANADMVRSEYKEVEIQCDVCGSYFPEKYDTRDYFGSICPYCTNDEMDDLTQLRSGICVQCGSTYDLGRSSSEGLCDDCYWESHGECVNCGDYAEYALKDTNEEYWCIHCIGDAMQSKNVTRAIRNYIDYGY